MKILVFNVKYSENLGDGLLAQCLETTLRSGAGEPEVETLDLAGRTAFGATHGRRQLAIRLLHLLPAFARRTAVKRILRPQLEVLRERWDKQLSTVDAVVIGGGNLFQDDDLNFPLKVGLALDCIRRSGRPLIIHAVGVTATWSRPALALFARLQDTNLVLVSVRDEISRQNWERHFPDGPRAVVKADPGLLTRDLVAEDIRKDHGGYRGTVGLCVTAPIILERHATIARSAIPLKSAGDYCDTIQKLAIAGYRITLFCNGAREDQSCAEALLARDGMAALLASKQVTLSPRPIVPEDLVLILKSTTIVVAHRLHACIAAYSLGIAPIGLGWDQKVSGFFQSVDRSDYYLSGRNVTPAQICSLVMTAQENQLDPLQHALKLSGARAAIASILPAIQPSQAVQKIAQKANEMVFQRKTTVT